MCRVAETLPQEVLTKMYAPEKDASIPTIDAATLEKYDAFLFGIPTRYGNFPAQWKAFWDTTGSQWSSGAYWGKYAGVFISTATQGGGQESTAIAAMSTLTHHGMIYVPLGYKTTFGQLANLNEIHGGSPWGAGTFAVSGILALLNFIININRVLTVAANHPLSSSRSHLFKERPSVTMSKRSHFD